MLIMLSLDVLVVNLKTHHSQVVAVDLAAGGCPNPGKYDKM
jgi:hypothetical protein